MVDDDRLVAATLARELGVYGYHVDAAVSGAEARVLCAATRYDLALLDVRMPETSGLQLAELLAREHALPFVFLSAFSDSDTVRQAIQRGAMGYLVKPIDISQIIPEIETALVRADELRAARERAAQLDNALSARRETSIAVGILMARDHVDRIRAFEQLRQRARRERRRIEEVAAETVRDLECGEGAGGPAEPDSHTR